MNEGTRRRLGALEVALAPEERPRELRWIGRERTFESHAALLKWTKDQESAQRARRGPESIDTIRVTVVSLAAPGESPTERDLGDLQTKTRAKYGCMS